VGRCHRPVKSLMDREKFRFRQGTKPKWMSGTASEEKAAEKGREAQAPQAMEGGKKSTAWRDPIWADACDGE
jgi:hypothetical protein